LSVKGVLDHRQAVKKTLFEGKERKEG